MCLCSRFALFTRYIYTAALLYVFIIAYKLLFFIVIYNKRKLRLIEHESTSLVPRVRSTPRCAHSEAKNL